MGFSFILKARFCCCCCCFSNVIFIFFQKWDSEIFFVTEVFFFFETKILLLFFYSKILHYLKGTFGFSSKMRFCYFETDASFFSELRFCFLRKWDSLLFWNWDSVLFRNSDSVLFLNQHWPSWAIISLSNNKRWWIYNLFSNNQSCQFQNVLNLFDFKSPEKNFQSKYLKKPAS